MHGSACLPGDLPAGAYVTLENDSDQPAVLSGASSPPMPT
jgi:copper(I)-binding protein